MPFKKKEILEADSYHCPFIIKPALIIINMTAGQTFHCEQIRKGKPLGTQHTALWFMVLHKQRSLAGL